MAFDGGREQGGEGGRSQGIDLFGDLSGQALGKLIAQELEVLLVDAAKRAVAGSPFQVQLLLHLIAPCVCDLITKLAKLHQVAPQGALGDAGAFGQLEGIEARLSDDDGKDP